MNQPGINSQIIFLDTHDLDLTHHFYHAILGFPLVLDQGTCRIYQTCNDSYIGFCLRPDVEIDPSNIILTFVVSDVDRWFQYLIENGEVIHKRPEKNLKYNIYHCFLRDPNGYQLEIQKFLDPRWK